MTEDDAKMPETVPGGLPFNDADPLMGYNRVWFNLLRVHRHLGPQIEKKLRAAGIGHPVWYEILLAVEQAGPEGLLMARLEERLFVAQYALSRHVSRIEAAGFIRREATAADRRAQLLFITPDGAGLHDRIWPAYLAAIQETIGERMTTEEAYDLTRLLIRLYP